VQCEKDCLASCRVAEYRHGAGCCGGKLSEAHANCRYVPGSAETSTGEAEHEKTVMCEAKHEHCHHADDDKCLKESDEWGAKHECASSKEFCESWSKDMQRCCPVTCETMPVCNMEACEHLSGKGTCTNLPPTKEEAKEKIAEEKVAKAAEEKAVEKAVEKKVEEHIEEKAKKDEEAKQVQGQKSTEDEAKKEHAEEAKQASSHVEEQEKGSSWYGKMLR